MPIIFAFTMRIFGTRTVGYLPVVMDTSSPTSWELHLVGEWPLERRGCVTLQSLPRINCLTQDSEKTLQFPWAAEVPVWVSWPGKMRYILGPTVYDQESAEWIMHISWGLFNVKYWNKVESCQALPGYQQDSLNRRLRVCLGEAQVLLPPLPLPASFTLCWGDTSWVLQIDWVLVELLHLMRKPLTPLSGMENRF